MAKELLWAEDMDSVMGWARDFESKDDFINEVKHNYEDGDCNVFDVEKRLCISTEKGIEAETICPIEDTDIEMEWFYIASVESLEE
jgi:hypothetical protein